MNKLQINPEQLNDSIPMDALSLQYQAIVNAVVNTFQCSRDMVIAGMFATVGTAIGKRFVIDDGKYQNYPCLWVCNVAPSGSNKSQPMRFLLKPLKDRDASNYKEYLKELGNWRTAGDDKTEKPKFKQILISDSTPEARSQVLANNPNGILLYRDELKGMIDDFGRYSRSGELSQLLSIFDSDNIVINRKSDDTLLIERPFMSILGSIQPSVLLETFGSDLMMANGFIQRWLFTYPGQVPPAMYSDSIIPQSITNDWKTFVINISIYDYSVDGGTLYLRGEAKKVYIDFYNKLQTLKANADDYMCSVYSKMQIYAIRWAGIAHMLGNNPYSIDITPEEMDYSCRCMDYFIRCAEKVYLKLLEGRKRQPKEKRLSKEQLIAMCYNSCAPKSKQAFADAIGVSRPFVSRAVNKYPLLRCYGYGDALESDNEDDSVETSVTT